MKYFSYNEYIDYYTNDKIKKMLTLEDKKIKYEINKALKSEKLITDEYNNSIDVLNDFKNPIFFHNFLNKHFYLNNFFKIQDFKICNNFIKNHDGCEYIIYKDNNKEIYFFINVLSQIDYNIPYKMLNYSIKIIDNWQKINKKQKKQRHPIVIPIVVYIGKKPWTSETNKIINLKYTYFEKNKINLAYNIVEINKEK